jgi:hypothetical protein
MKYEELVTHNKYPDGKGIHSVRIRHRTIGSYTDEVDGFLVNGCRKPSETEEDAVKKILKKRLKDIKKEESVIFELLTM